MARKARKKTPRTDMVWGLVVVALGTVLWLGGASDTQSNSQGAVVAAGVIITLVGVLQVLLAALALARAKDHAEDAKTPPGPVG